MKAVFDTNIIIDYLDGYEKARAEISKYKKIVVSTITYLEVLTGAKDEKEIIVIKSLFRKFKIIPVTEKLSETAAFLRNQYRLKTADAVILATAYEEECLLVTRDEKAFDLKNIQVRFPYKI